MTAGNVKRAAEIEKQERKLADEKKDLAAGFALEERAKERTAASSRSNLAAS